MNSDSNPPWRLQIHGAIYDATAIIFKGDQRIELGKVVSIRIGSDDGRVEIQGFGFLILVPREVLVTSEVLTPDDFVLERGRVRQALNWRGMNKVVNADQCTCIPIAGSRLISQRDSACPIHGDNSRRLLSQTDLGRFEALYTDDGGMIQILEEEQCGMKIRGYYAIWLGWASDRSAAHEAAKFAVEQGLGRAHNQPSGW